MSPAGGSPPAWRKAGVGQWPADGVHHRGMVVVAVGVHPNGDDGAVVTGRVLVICAMSSSARTGDGDARQGGPVGQDSDARLSHRPPSGLDRTAQTTAVAQYARACNFRRAQPGCGQRKCSPAVMNVKFGLKPRPESGHARRMA